MLPRPNKRSSVWWLLLLLFLLPVISVRQQTNNVHANDDAPKPAANWWSISDLDFVTQYGKLATATQEQQSQFAWMAFARANQQVPNGMGTQKFSQWELWPSDPDTFTPDVARFDAAKKVRTRPHLQPIEQFRMFKGHGLLAEATPFPQAGQETTRNALSYGYIMDTHLNHQDGIAAYLGKKGNKIEFPVGAVEVKAVWEKGAIKGAHQLGGFSLTALHLMVKVKPSPSDPFTDNSPSWFWTTFELNTNQGLAAAQKFITYGDVLPPAEVQGLLKQAGLASTAFVNYVSNGQQIQFDDAKHKTIVLGNTKLEWAFATPQNPDPTTWKSWSSSCHSCHGQASGKINGSGMSFFRFTAPVGPLQGDALPPAGYHPYDFVWALARAQ